MKKFLVIGAGIIGALIVLALIAPFLINLNNYKAEIQQKALQATGREVVINGDIRLGFLPAPYARLTDVVIKNPPGAKSENFATVKAIDVGVALAPLLSKKIQVTHIDITEPSVTLEVMANGQNNWQFKPDSVKEAADNAEAVASTPTNLSVDDLNIEKAFIRYIDVPGQSQQVVGPINGKFNIASLNGPVSGKGDLTVLDSLPITFETTIESLPSADNKTIPFQLALGILKDAAKADFKGTIQTDDTVTARVDSVIAVDRLAKILGAVSKDGKTPELPAFLLGKTVFNGLVDYKNDHATIDNLSIRAGNAELSGSIDAALAETKSITLDLKNVVLPPELASSATAPKNDKAAATPLAETLRAGFAQAAGLLNTALPKAPLNLIVTAAQLPLPGGQPTLRDVRLAASSSPKGVTIQDIEAKLPGNTTLQVNGSLPARADGMIDHAVLNTKLSTQSLQAALGKDGPVSATATSVQTTINLTRESLYLKPLQITQGGQSIQGDMIYNPQADKALVITLKGNAIDLNSLLAKSPSDKAAAAGSADKSGKADADPLTRLQGLKALITADIGSVTYQEKIAKNIAMQLNLSDKGLDITRATIGDLGGMQISATGGIDRLSPLSGVDIAATAKTASLSQTLKALGNSNAANLGASQFDAKLKGDTDNLQVALNGSIDQGKLAINGTAKDLNTSPGFTGTVDVSHPETATILRNFAGQKPTVNLGAFALKTNLTYGTNTLKADDLSVQLGSAGKVTGHVNVTPDNGTRKIDADLKADKLALAALMGDDSQTTAAAVDTSQPKAADTGWSKEPINLAALRNLNGSASIEIGELLYKKFVINNFKTTLKFANNALNLDTLKGNLFGAGDFSVNGQLAPGAENQAHRGDFNMTLDKVDAPKLFVALGSKPFNKGTIDLTQKLGFNGASPFAIINTLNGQGQLKVVNGIVNGIDLDALAAKLDRPNSLSDFAAIMDQARAGGETAISDVTMPINIRNGVVQVQNTAITTQKTKMDVYGTVNLPPKLVDLTGQIAFTEQRNLPPLTLFVRGPMNNPQKSFDTGAFTKFYALKATEKLRENIGNKLGGLGGLGGLLGLSTTPAPTASPAAVTPATSPATPTAPSGIATPTAPVAPTVNNPATSNKTPAATPKQQRDDALKQLGGQMLNNLLGGGR